MTEEQIAGLGPALTGFLGGFRKCFARVPTFKHLGTYCRGLLSDLAWQEYQTLLALCPKNRKTHATDDGVRQTFAWVGQLEHVGDQTRRHRGNAFQCKETHDGQSIRNVLIVADATNPTHAAKIQIRLDTS